MALAAWDGPGWAVTARRAAVEIEGVDGGAMPIGMMLMMRPWPFWPVVLRPWAKLTPVQVRQRMERIQRGGAFLGSGSV